MALNARNRRLARAAAQNVICIRFRVPHPARALVKRRGRGLTYIMGDVGSTIYDTLLSPSSVLSQPELAEWLTMRPVRRQ